MPGDLSLRPLDGREDQDFDLSVYGSTRKDELAGLGWTADQIDQFVHLQYRAQTLHYRRHFPEANFSIVVVGGEPVGRLVVARLDRVLLIVDLALLPRYRSAGIGGRLVRQLLTEADETGLSVCCHVEASNPAQGFWEHLGLLAIRVDGAHVFMERKCATPAR